MANETARMPQASAASVSAVTLTLDHQTGVFQMALSGPMNEMIILYLLHLADGEVRKARTAAQSRIVQPVPALVGLGPARSQ